MAMNINHVWKHATSIAWHEKLFSELVVLPHLRTISKLKLNARWPMPRTRILSKIRFLCKLTSQKNNLPSHFDLTFDVKVWAFSETVFENKTAFVEQWRNRKYFLERSSLVWQVCCPSSAKSHHTRYIMFSEMNLNFDNRTVWAQLPYLNISKGSGKTGNKKKFLNSSFLSQIHVKEDAITFPTSF